MQWMKHVNCIICACISYVQAYVLSSEINTGQEISLWALLVHFPNLLFLHVISYLQLLLELNMPAAQGMIAAWWQKGSFSFHHYTIWSWDFRPGPCQSLAYVILWTNSVHNECLGTLQDTIYYLVSYHGIRSVPQLSLEVRGDYPLWRILPEFNSVHFVGIWKHSLPWKCMYAWQGRSKEWKCAN